MAKIKGTTIVRVKVCAADGWFTLSTHYNWENALAAYNSAPTPKMLTTKAKIVHKQYTDNGFVYSGSDPRPPL